MLPSCWGGVGIVAVEEDHTLRSTDLVNFPSHQFIDGELKLGEMRGWVKVTPRVRRGAEVRVNSSASLPFPSLSSVRKLSPRLVIAKTTKHGFFPNLLTSRWHFLHMTQGFPLLEKAQEMMSFPFQ